MDFEFLKELQPHTQTQLTAMTAAGFAAFLRGFSEPDTLLILEREGEERWGLAAAAAAFASRPHNTRIDTVPPNPTDESAAAALRSLSDTPKVVIAVGGGSAIDLGKAICCFSHLAGSGVTGEQIRAEIVSGDYRGRAGEFLPLVAVPTTAGTGSEVTPWATVWEQDGAGKMSIDSPALLPREAIVVPAFTYTMPPRGMVTTALDALTHAVESYWAKASTEASRPLSLAAARAIVEHLPAAALDPENKTARDGLCEGSLRAGVAFSHTRTAACHSISYPLSQLHGMAHGVAAAITLAPVAARNGGHYPGEARLMEIFAPFGGIGGFIAWVTDGILPLRLSVYGVTERDLPCIADAANTKGRMDNNPRELTREDVLKILREVL